MIFGTNFMFFTFGPNKNEDSIDVIPKTMDNQIKSITDKHETNKSQNNPMIILKLFDSKRYEEVERNDVQAADSCVQTWLKVAY